MKLQKLIDRFSSVPSDFTWDELVKVLAAHGYTEAKTGKTGGSRRKFIDESNNIISLHKPHPINIVKRYAIREVIAHLKAKGKLNE